MKKRIVVICFFSLSLLINIIPLFIFKDKVGFTYISIYSLIFMIAMSLNGLFAYIFRHKRNYLNLENRSISFSDKAYTFTEKYTKKFYWQFIVYVFSIPFFIPCIAFGTRVIHGLWIICVVFVPQIIYFVNDIFEYATQIKEIRIDNQKHAQELKKQKEREELGYFK